MAESKDAGFPDKFLADLHREYVIALDQVGKILFGFTHKLSACPPMTPSARLLLRVIASIWASAQKTDTFEYYATEHLRMSGKCCVSSLVQVAHSCAGVYWATMALYLLGHVDKVDKAKIIPWIMACKHSNGTL